jgi:hypothetical protein
MVKWQFNFWLSIVAGVFVAAIVGWSWDTLRAPGGIYQCDAGLWPANLDYRLQVA